jgi:hypothetical protein
LDVTKDKAKKKKAKLKKTVIDGVGLVMGDSAGKFVESIIDLTQSAKVPFLSLFFHSLLLNSYLSYLPSLHTTSLFVSSFTTLCCSLHLLMEFKLESD